MISLDIFMKPVRVEVNDKMQKGYVYFRTKQMGRAFRPGFAPGADAETDARARRVQQEMQTDLPGKNFMPSWFERAKLSPDRARASLNYFGVNASQPLAEWQRKGWIHPRRSARLVSMVLPLLLRAPQPGRLTPDRALARGSPPCGAIEKTL